MSDIIDDFARAYSRVEPLAYRDEAIVAGRCVLALRHAQREAMRHLAEHSGEREPCCAARLDALDRHARALMLARVLGDPVLRATLDLHRSSAGPSFFEQWIYIGSGDRAERAFYQGEAARIWYALVAEDALPARARSLLARVRALVKGAVDG